MSDIELAAYFADLARQLLAVDSLEKTMKLLVLAAVEVIDDADHASISFMRGKSLVSASSSDDVGSVLDGIQTGAQEGPCMEAIRTGMIVESEDIRNDERWPSYGPRAVESTTVRASAAFPLHDGQRTIGALNLFSDELGAFSAAERSGTVALVVSHATAALAAAVHREDMRAALDNRDVIGQAKGMLMARSSIDEKEAFELLARASQRMNVKVAEVARRLISGELSESPD